MAEKESECGCVCLSLSLCVYLYVCLYLCGEEERVGKHIFALKIKLLQYHDMIRNASSSR